MKKTFLAISLLMAMTKLSSQNASTADIVIESLKNNISFTMANQSFSPNYSDIGLGFDDNAGIQRLYLHYNRKTSEFGGRFLTINENVKKTDNEVLRVKQYFTGNGSAEYVFYDRNTWLVECNNVNEIFFHFGADTNINEGRISSMAKDFFIFEGYLPTKDKRDPDKQFPVILGLRIIEGSASSGDGIVKPLSITPSASQRILLAMTVNMLEIDRPHIQELLINAPQDAGDAYAASYAWFRKALGNLSFGDIKSEKEKKALSLAAYTLAFNSCLAPGYLAGRVSVFPSRGGYPSHYLWDACFENLAVEYMEPRLAEDALLLLLNNLRVDGKMAQFLCSTWMRPNESQPPLVGWAAMRLVQQRQSTELAKQLLPSLIKNTNWWLTQRMTRYGLLVCDNPLETGWDNTPRLDSGAVVALDMNTYLLLQMQACSYLAGFIGDYKMAKEWKYKSEIFAKKITDKLYDAENNIFREVSVKTGKMTYLLTPANFIPLLANVPLDNNKAKDMISKYLLNKDLFFGAIPFPSVAYNEKLYSPGEWWRGPTWISPAWFMLEILKKYGFVAEYKEAEVRLYNMIINDGYISELFNSKTGKGMGNKQYGWTAAVLLKLKMEME